MAAEENNSSQSQGDNGASNAAAAKDGSANSSGSSSSASKTESRTSPEPKTQTVPTSVFKQIKADHFEKGRTAAMKEADARARKLGYESFEDMTTKLEASKSGQTSQPRNGGNGKGNGQQRPTNGGGNTRQASRHDNQNRHGYQPPTDARKAREERIRDRQLRREQEARDAALAKAKETETEKERLERENKELEERLALERAEGELNLLAHRCGVHDVEYAITCLRRHCKGMTDEQLESFKDEQYFKEDLKKEKPYLYEAVSVPATTGNGQGAAGATDAAPPAGATGGTGQADRFKNLTAEQIKKLPDKDFADLLASRGISHPTLGMISG